MILFSSGMGLAIEVWKLRKAVKSVAIETAPGARVPSLRLTPADSYEFSETKLYDEEAMAYLSLALYPVVVGYAMYSLAYDSHKSWYVRAERGREGCGESPQSSRAYYRARPGAHSERA